jgi:hypothetical protein
MVRASRFVTAVLQGPVLQQCCCCCFYHNGLLDLGAIKYTRFATEKELAQVFKLRIEILRALCFQTAVAVAMLVVAAVVKRSRRILIACPF